MSKLEIIYASSSSLIGLGAKKNNLRKGIAEVVGSNYPPGPLFTVVQLQYWIESILGDCRSE